MTPMDSYERLVLALTIWREARGEDHKTKVAVACSIRNRVLHPKWWGNDYVSVCTKKWQYSSMTATSDPQLGLWPSITDFSFAECMEIADAVIDGELSTPIETHGADSYYDDSIAPPKWATPDKFVGKLGKLNFYNIDGETED